MLVTESTLSGLMNKKMCLTSPISGLDIKACPLVRDKWIFFVGQVEEKCTCSTPTGHSGGLYSLRFTNTKLPSWWDMASKNVAYYQENTVG